MINPINISGQKFEERVQLSITNSKHCYKRKQKCDFEVQTAEGLVAVEAKAQKGTGSVDEKLPTTVWKYFNVYNYNELILVLHEKFVWRTEWLLSCINSQVPSGKKLTICYGVEQFENYIKTLPIKEGILAFCEKEK